MRARLRRGLTLIETMFACLLIGVILVVLGEMLQWGLRAHRKGEAARKATTLAREISAHLSAEIATGLTLDTFRPDLVAGASRDFQSAVLWPDCYQDETSVFSETFYRRERGFVTVGNGQTVQFDRAYNRLVFTRPGKKSGLDFRDTDYAQFVHVEYLVVPPNAQGNGQNRLYRRLYQVSVPPSQDPRGVSLSDYRRVIDANFFTLDAAAPLDNPRMINAGLTAKEREEQCVIFNLPKPDDQISFTIEHLRFVANNGQQPPKVPAFDPSLFTVKVTVSLDKQEKFLATQTLSEQARVRAGQ